MQLPCVLVHASGRNIRPSCASSRKTGRNETTIISSEKNSAGPTCLAASIRIVCGVRSRGRVSCVGASLGEDVSIAVLDHDDGGIDEHADCERQPA